MKFMNQAFVYAKRAFAHDDVPIGAVIVRDGKIIENFPPGMAIPIEAICSTASSHNERNVVLVRRP